MSEEPKNPDVDLLLSGEAALLVGVTPATIRSWTANGRLPAIVTPRGVRLIRRADLERVIAERVSA